MHAAAPPASQTGAANINQLIHYTYFLQVHCNSKCTKVHKEHHQTANSAVQFQQAMYVLRTLLCSTQRDPARVSSTLGLVVLTYTPAAFLAGRKVRFDGNDDDLIELAKKNAMALGAGHTFIIFIDGGFPVNCLNAVKAVPEVCRIHCATANPTSVVIAKTSDDAKVRAGMCGVDRGLAWCGALN